MCSSQPISSSHLTARHAQLSSQNANDSRYSYGWHRAEILAALINGVFLLALCFSITMEALERFFSTPGAFISLSPQARHSIRPEISNPRLVVIVGSFGLASNIVGLFLFHGKESLMCLAASVTIHRRTWSYRAQGQRSTIPTCQYTYPPK